MHTIEDNRTVYDKIVTSYYDDFDNSIFKEDLEREFGLTQNPKRHVLFAKAWQFGHAYGYNEAYSYYVDLMELIE